VCPELRQGAGPHVSSADLPCSSVQGRHLDSSGWFFPATLQLLPCSTQNVITLPSGLPVNPELSSDPSVLAALLTHRLIPGPTDTRAETDSRSPPPPFCELKVRSQREKTGSSSQRLPPAADFQGAASPSPRGPPNQAAPAQTPSKALVSLSHRATHLPRARPGLAEVDFEMQSRVLPGSRCRDHRAPVTSEPRGYVCSCREQRWDPPSTFSPPNPGGWLLLMVSRAGLSKAHVSGISGSFSKGVSVRASDCQMSSVFYSKQQGHVKQVTVCLTFISWIKQKHQGKANEGP